MIFVPLIGFTQESAYYSEQYMYIDPAKNNQTGKVDKAVRVTVDPILSVITFKTETFTDAIPFFKEEITEVKGEKVIVYYVKNRKDIEYVTFTNKKTDWEIFFYAGDNSKNSSFMVYPATKLY